MKASPLLAVLVVLPVFIACKKFIEVDAPVNSITPTDVYADDKTAAAVVSGIYQKMSTQNVEQFRDVGLLASMYTNAGLCADELVLYDRGQPLLNAYYTNNLASSEVQNYWMNIYPVIFVINSVLEGVESSHTLTPAVKQQLLGEAMFLRAFHYFYLVNFYGDVPLALHTDYKDNMQLPRAPKEQVYEQMIKDLKSAQDLLSDRYLGGDAFSAYPTGNAERVRPTRWTASALLSRVYLYTGDFVNAVAQATEVISNTSLYGLTTPDNTFLKNNREAIWQLQPGEGHNSTNTGEARFFILPSSGPALKTPIYLSPGLISSFEANDRRQQKWIGKVAANGHTWYYPFKYRITAEAAPSAEYPVILRLAELYLIRAEARAMLGNLEGAASDLDMIRRRAGLPGTRARTQPAMLKAVLHERRVELFTEWGHRWFDLIRTGNANAVLAPLKRANWQSTDQLFPIPQAELLRSPGLNGRQNPGYE